MLAFPATAYPALVSIAVNSLEIPRFQALSLGNTKGLLTCQPDEVTIHDSVDRTIQQIVEIEAAPRVPVGQQD
jgi:hypothetical protein